MSLLQIQAELKAPKSQFNSFGKYNYRSAEDILEAVKPLLVKYNCCLTINDEVVQVGDRIYIKSTATFHNSEGQTLSVSAFAREAESKKGMDDSQVSGATASYAKKYALGNLFLLDDNKDADHQPKVEPKVEKSPFISQAQMLDLQNKLNAFGISTQEFCEAAKIPALAKLPADKFDGAVAFAAKLAQEKGNG